MAATLSRSEFVTDGSASGLPVMTGYQDDPFVDEIERSLWPRLAAGAPVGFDAWLASFGAAIRAMADVHVTGTASSTAGMTAPAIRVLTERAQRAYLGATVDRAKVPLWDELLGYLLEAVPSADARSPQRARKASETVSEEAMPSRSAAPKGAASAGSPSEAVHSRLASELRKMTGLSSSVLGEAIGVSREQYSRWVSGRPISAMRHGQLRYLHTIARDLVRRLGQERAAVWLRTPQADQGSPVDLLERRRLDLLHRAVAALPDPSPIQDGTIVALAAPMETSEDAEEERDIDAEEAWSPYANSTQLGSEHGAPPATT